MAIKSGRNGAVKYDRTGGGSPLVTLASINQWSADLKTDFDEVTSFGDTNKVFVPGMRDISGQLAGFWNAAEVSLPGATTATIPGYLQLIPNTTESAGSPTGVPALAGTAWIDWSITVPVNGAPKIASSFKAAGAWTGPEFGM
jgi:hypothetical protein